jgi:aspartyl-tRNA(Asn)/glutamyl-tRNA(Gln) amidotransferase subunit A
MAAELAPPDLSLSTAAHLVRTRQLSPVELTAALLQRIERLNPTLGAYLFVTAEQALATARLAEQEISRGHYRGPLHGIPYAVKDIFWTKGVPTTAHSRLLATFVPDDDATAVARLQAAGAVLLGKLALYEFALGPPDPTTPFPPARNPWDLSRTPGGSSSGCGTAVAAGLALAALGSDTGGSIRIPAAGCGIVGMKPTPGRVSRYGVIPLSWSLDTVGPMTRTVRDNALVLDVIAGYDRKDPMSVPILVPASPPAWRTNLLGLRIGVPVNALHQLGEVDPEVLLALEQAQQTFRQLGATVQTVTFPHLEQAEHSFFTIMLAEAAEYHRTTLAQQPEQYGHHLRERLLTGARIAITDYLQAQQARCALRQAYQEVLTQVDALLLPTLPQPPPPLAALFSGQAGTLSHFTRLFNLVGLPALALPAGFSRSGLPLGVQLAGRPFAEALLYQLGAAYEAATGWHLRWPTLASEMTSPAAPRRGCEMLDMPEHRI